MFIEEKHCWKKGNYIKLCSMKKGIMQKARISINTLFLISDFQQQNTEFRSNVSHPICKAKHWANELINVRMGKKGSDKV